MAEVITNNTSGQSGSPSSRFKPSFRPTKDLGLVIILLAALIIVAVLVAGLVNRSRNSPNYTYGSLSTYNLNGSQAGSGISFQKPTQMDEVVPLKKGVYAQRFVHDKQLTNGKYITLSYEAAAIAYVAPTTDSQDTIVKQVNQSLTDPSNKFYKAYQYYYQLFIKNNTSTRFSFSYDKPKAITTPNIKSGVWEVDFTGVDNKPISVNTPTHITGRMLLAVSQNKFYYFLVSSVNDDWQKNQSTWQKIIDSVKIDQ